MGMNNAGKRMADIVKPPSSENRALIRKIALNTGQTLVISDLSRKISADACVVIMQAAMEIRVEPDLFENEPLSGITFEQIRDTLGETVIYEYRLERNFIMDHEKETVLASLVDTFMKNTGRYISKPGFAPKLVLKEYRNRTQSAGPSKKGEQD